MLASGRRHDFATDEHLADLAGRGFQALAADPGRALMDPVEVLTEELGISAEHAAAVLDWLRERKLYGVNGHAALNSPEHAVLSLLGRAGEELTRFAQDALRWQGALADLARLSARGLGGAEAAPVEVIRFSDKDQARRWLDDYAPFNTRNAVMMHPAFPSNEILRQGLNIDLELLGRGVEFKMLASRTAVRRPGTTKYLDTLHAAGAQIRVARAVPMRMIVLDGRTSLVDLLDVDGPLHVVIRSELVGLCLLSIFDCLWADAAGYVPAAGESLEPAEGLTSVHISLLKALATGAKDETIARLLGCSERTLRRQIAQTLSELGVRSRFAAGARAAQLGLLD